MNGSTWKETKWMKSVNLFTRHKIVKSNDSVNTWLGKSHTASQRLAFSETLSKTGWRMKVLIFRTGLLLTSSFVCVDCYLLTCFTRTPAGFTERPLRSIKFEWKLDFLLREIGCKIRQLSIIANQQSIKMNQLDIF